MKDAEKCLEAGVKGIVVSHHHGIIDYAVPPLMILPEIVRVVQKQIPVFVDCGVERQLRCVQGIGTRSGCRLCGQGAHGGLCR